MMGHHKYPVLDVFSNPAPPQTTTFQHQYVRDFDWSKSLLGPIDRWPVQLRQMVNVSQRDLHGCCIFWDVPGENGVTDVIVVYNEAYTFFIGQKHPALQGTDPKIGFAELWEYFANLLETGRQTGAAQENRDSFLLMDRYGFLEETYFSWKFVPIVGPEGYVVGHYNTAVDRTQEVLNARRLNTIQDLGQIIASSLEDRGRWSDLLIGLQGNDKDVPLALLYSLVERKVSALSQDSDNVPSGPWCCLEGTIGVDGNKYISPRQIDLNPESKDLWASAFNIALSGHKFYTSFSPGDGVLPRNICDNIEWQGFGIPSNEFVVCPIRSLNSTRVLSILVIGLNPRRPYDKEYRDWIELLIKSIATPHVEAAFAAADTAKIAMQFAKQSKDLEASKKQFIDFATRSTVGILLTQPDGDLIFANEAWEALIERPATKRAEWNFSIHKDDQEMRTEKWKEVTIEKKAVSYNLRFNKRWRAPSYLAPEGTETCTYVLASLWPDLDENGEIRCVMCTVTDISEIKFVEDQLRQQTVEAEHRVKQQEAFVDMVSHEIRNPLSAILHCADEISSLLAARIAHPLSQDESHSIIQSADTIAYCAMHQKRIVDDILTLSKLDSNLLTLSPQLVEPISLVETALKMFDSELKKLDMQIRLRIDRSMRDLKVHYLLFDSSRFLQVLVNLMTNAVKFTRDSNGRKEISVSLSASSEPPTDNENDISYVPIMETIKTPNHVWCDWPPDETIFLTCNVADTGKGITASELTGLFHRFSQASPKTQVQYGGSGLGLYISRQLSEMQGGRIGVKSEYGIGSTFTFYIRTCRARDSGSPDLKKQIPDFDRVKEELPLACGSGANMSEFDPPSSSYSTLPAEALPDNLGTKRKRNEDIHILIVEDNIVNQRVLARGLRSNGFEISVANHGGECLSFLETTGLWAPNVSPNKGKPVSLILMDWEMPIMDGLTCVKKIRELERERWLTSHIPIIGVTANARNQQISAAKEAGMDDVVTKPYRISEILCQIMIVLEKSDDIEMT